MPILNLVCCHSDDSMSLMPMWPSCLGSVYLLENLRFHVEEEGKGVDGEGKKVSYVILFT